MNDSLLGFTAEKNQKSNSIMPYQKIGRNFIIFRVNRVHIYNMDFLDLTKYSFSKIICCAKQHILRYIYCLFLELLITEGTGQGVVLISSPYISDDQSLWRPNHRYTLSWRRNSEAKFHWAHLMHMKWTKIVSILFWTSKFSSCYFIDDFDIARFKIPYQCIFSLSEM